MERYVLIQNVNKHNPGDCGVRIRLGSDVHILETYHWANHRITLIESPSSPQDMITELENWVNLQLSNLIAWEIVS